MASSTSTAVVIHHSNSNHAHGHPVPADVVVDALPYYDSGYDEPGVREAVSKSFLFCYCLILFILGFKFSRR
jgi:hypothetical protein